MTEREEGDELQPRRRKLTEMLREKVHEVIPGDPYGRTHAEALADALFERAERGDIGAIKLLWLIVEGPVPKRIEVEEACAVVCVVTCVPAAPRAELPGRPAVLPAVTEGSER
jgi:hypothetical protein